MPPRLLATATAAVLSLVACRTALIDDENGAPVVSVPDLGAPDLTLPPTSPPWPMPRHDPRASSRSPLAGPDQPRRAYHSSIFPYDPTGGLGVVVGLDGTVYAATGGSLMAFGPVQLNVKWKAGAISDGPSWVAIGPDGRLYKTVVEGPRSSVAAYSPSGSQVWRDEVPDELLLVGQDGTLFVHTTDGTDRLAALFHVMPAVKWSMPAGGLRPRVQADSGVLVALETDTSYAALDGDTGKRLGTIRFGGCETIDALGRVSCAQRGGFGTFFHVLPLSGDFTSGGWKYADMAAFTGSWAESTDGLMIVANGPSLYALDAGLRTDLATIAVPAGGVAAGPPLIDGDNNLYLATARTDQVSGSSVVSYTYSGVPRWSLAVEDADQRLIVSPLALGRDNTLFFATCTNLGSAGAPRRGACRLDAIAP